MTQIDPISPTGYVNQWDFDGDGYPACLLDGCDAAAEPSATLALQKSFGVQTLIGLVEAYEDAERTIIRGAPDNGAAALVAAASPTTIAHALWRTPEPDTTQATALAAWQAAQATVQAAFATLAAQALASDPRPVPASVSLWQAKAVLQQQGLLAQADAAITAQNNPILNAFWASASQLDRASPTLAALAVALNLTGAEVDAMFRAAAAIKL